MLGDVSIAHHRDVMKLLRSRMETARLLGDYKLGPKIGCGSFSVVWLAKHRSSGLEVTAKEIDKKLLSPEVKGKSS
ncbi:unnamed protein product [Microthlaspi erraticum]|uniref:Protein kinase domain-containing protein n=1 Tax=Microthlaspi erraticum TaxID=1685480 RepID=A0A6D2I4K6_9BRAS|nr:unnamed protein product [Microthlaspi erraticum]